MGRSLLDIRGLCCERDDRTLFHDLDFSLASGEIVQLSGPNGSGKTTLLRIIAGLFLSYRGDVVWRGRPRDDNLSDFHQDVLYLGHRSGVKAALTPFENLRFLSGLHGEINTPELLSALERVGLAGYEHSPSRNLSAGQQRRIALARLFLSDASIWLLDEMFTAIDLDGVSWFEQFLTEQAGQGRGILLTTHHVLSISNVRRVQLGQLF